MKRFHLKLYGLLALLSLALAGFALAQYEAPSTPAATGPPPQQPPDNSSPPPPQQQPSPDAAGPLLSADQLDDLVAPIALYPDVLVAQILPAATFPQDVVEAERLVQQYGGDAAPIDQQNWDPSVKAIAHHLEVLDIMNERLDWTRALGDAVSNQQQDVLDAIQRMRARAEQTGALKDTPEQSVQNEGGDIVIQPADPQVIFVPEYDPQVVYVDGGAGYETPAVTFGVGVPPGPWLNMDCDWRNHHVYYGGWGYRHGFAHTDQNVNVNRQANINNINPQANINRQANIGHAVQTNVANLNRPWKPTPRPYDPHRVYSQTNIDNHHGWEGSTARRSVDSASIERGLSERRGGAMSQPYTGPNRGQTVRVPGISSAPPQTQNRPQVQNRQQFQSRPQTQNRQQPESRTGVQNSGVERMGAFSDYHSGRVSQEYSQRGASSRSSVGNTRSGSEQRSSGSSVSRGSGSSGYRSSGSSGSRSGGRSESGMGSRGNTGSRGRGGGRR